MLQVVVPIWLQNLEIWEKWHTCELVGDQGSPKRQKVFCSFADVTGDFTTELPALHILHWAEEYCEFFLISGESQDSGFLGH
jgi:hypothetical protein